MEPRPFLAFFPPPLSPLPSSLPCTQRFAFPTTVPTPMAGEPDSWETSENNWGPTHPVLRSLIGGAKKRRRSCYIKAPPALEILTLKPYPAVPSPAENHSPKAKCASRGPGVSEAVLGRMAIAWDRGCSPMHSISPPGPARTPWPAWSPSRRSTGCWSGTWRHSGKDRRSRSLACSLRQGGSQRSRAPRRCQATLRRDLWLGGGGESWEGWHGHLALPFLPFCLLAQAHRPLPRAAGRSQGPTTATLQGGGPFCMPSSTWPLG